LNQKSNTRPEGSFDFDVAIVGYGPVGQALAGLLGRAGHRVGVFERHREIYRLPRAVHLDHEIMRLLQSLDLAGVLAEEMVPVEDYQWFGADGELLLRFDRQGLAPSGWEASYMFFQPELEAAIHRHACVPAGVTVERGWVAEGLLDAGSQVELTLHRVSEEEPGQLARTGERRTVRARWLVGADGANSFVRETVGITRRDLGFQERWLVVDAEPYDMGALAHLPIASQHCDPTRPTTIVQSGPRHRRWEFMLLPQEQPSDFEDPARVWALLAPWYGPQDGPLTRSTVYEFRSMVADDMRQGRVLLVGDAAHLTPPFMGQGLCSGLRDAANLAWKLDLVLRGLAHERLLNTVEAERQPQNEAVIRLAIELGKVLCQLDVGAAAERDAMLRSAGPPPPLGLAPLTAGVLHQPIGEPDPLAGTLSVQGVVEHAGRRGRFDDVVGAGFQLIVAGGDPLEALSHHGRKLLDTLGATVASLDPDAPYGVRDCDGRLTAWLSAHNAHAVLVRPDFYVFGTVASPQAVPALLEDLRVQLHMPDPRDLRSAHMTGAVIHPKLHHVNLKTTRLQEMIDFYRELVGLEVIFQDQVGAWLSNDGANHRVALLAFPNFVDDPEKDTRTGMHHSAFEYDSFDELNSAYLRLKEAGIEPALCLDHGMTFSYYYADPDGNNVELQVDCFGDWEKSKEWMRTSEEFKANPIGAFVDPKLVAADHVAGVSFQDIHAKAKAGGYAPEQAPIEIPEMSA
jgi:2-polyprenyl-6-methoxyphenol hydroxylase-like FAD-dependent oxidoreductase/catechol 2,3-dioxygenase-like lactoylglutathione lyase family enzyme